MLNITYNVVLVTVACNLIKVNRLDRCPHAHPTAASPPPPRSPPPPPPARTPAAHARHIPTNRNSAPGATWASTRKQCWSVSCGPRSLMLGVCYENETSAHLHTGHTLINVGLKLRQCRPYLIHDTTLAADDLLAELAYFPHGGDDGYEVHIQPGPGAHHVQHHHERGLLLTR